MSINLFKHFTWKSGFELLTRSTSFLKDNSSLSRMDQTFLSWIPYHLCGRTSANKRGVDRGEEAEKQMGAQRATRLEGNCLEGKIVSRYIFGKLGGNRIQISALYFKDLS